MAPSGAISRLVMIAFLAGGALSIGVPGWAESNQTGPRDSRFLRQPGMDWRIIESRQRRLIFQDQQQRYREEDRANVGRNQPNLYIPRVRPGCQAPLRGGASIGGCR
jgi:hypothetical protein